MKCIEKSVYEMVSLKHLCRYWLTIVAIKLKLFPSLPPQFLHSNRSVKFWVLGELARKRGIWREKEGSAELQEAAAVVVTGSDAVASVWGWGDGKVMAQELLQNQCFANCCCWFFSLQRRWDDVSWQWFFFCCCWFFLFFCLRSQMAANLYNVSAQLLCT